MNGYKQNVRVWTRFCSWWSCGGICIHEKAENILAVNLCRVNFKRMCRRSSCYTLLHYHTYLRTYCMEQSPSWETNRFSAIQKTPRILWNPKVHHPHSKEVVTCPYPEPDRSSPCPHFTSQRSILILSSHLHLSIPSGLFLQVYP